MTDIVYTRRPDSPPDITLHKYSNFLSVAVWYDQNLFHIDNAYNSDTEALTRIGVNKKYFYTAASYLEEILCMGFYSDADREKIITLLLEKNVLT
jgi:hypothetical protein